jgi:hypothetical protein
VGEYLRPCSLGVGDRPRKAKAVVYRSLSEVSEVGAGDEPAVETCCPAPYRLSEIL